MISIVNSIFTIVFLLMFFYTDKIQGGQDYIF
jgi:hypothetical protein